MPVGEGREVRFRRHASLFEGGVHRPVELLERVRESLGVPARVVGEGRGARVELGRVAEEDLVRPVAMPVTSMSSRRSASTWTTPMKPVPTTAAPIPLIPRRISPA